MYVPEHAVKCTRTHTHPIHQTMQTEDFSLFSNKQLFLYSTLPNYDRYTYSFIKYKCHLIVLARRKRAVSYQFPQTKSACGMSNAFIISDRE